MGQRRHPHWEDTRWQKKRYLRRWIKQCEQVAETLETWLREMPDGPSAYSMHLSAALASQRLAVLHLTRLELSI